MRSFPVSYYFLFYLTFFKNKKVGGCIKIASTNCAPPPQTTTRTTTQTTTTSTTTQTTTSTSTTPTRPYVTTGLMPFHLTYNMLVSWGYTFNEDEINLSNLNIGSIESSLFSKFNCLKKLTLRGNSILRLYQNTFKDCTCLKYLDLSYNKMSQLQQGDFDGAENVETFLINNNLLEQINLNTFLKMTSITNYSFANNPISNVYTLTLSNGVLTTTFIG